MGQNDFARFRLDILVKSFIAGAVIIITGLLFKQKLFSLGYLIGLLVSISQFSNMYSSIRALSGQKIKRIKLYLTLRYILFYLVLAIVLVASLRKGTSMFIGAIAGFLSIKLTIYVDAFLAKNSKLKTQNQN